MWASGQLVTDDQAQQAQVADDASVLGLRVIADDAPEQAAKFYLWPENVESWSLWMGLQTQWTYRGMDGTTAGLDYAGVQAALELTKNCRDERQRLFGDVQVCERAALSVWADERKRQARKQARKQGRKHGR